MNDLRNRISLVGNCGQPPVLRFTEKTSVPVTDFTLAVNHGRSDDPEKQPLWFTVELWNATAERACEFVQKGARVLVEGRFDHEGWTDRDGKTRCRLMVADASFLVLSKPSDAGDPPA